MASHFLGTAAGYRFHEWLRSQVSTRGSTLVRPTTREEVAPYQASVRQCMQEALGPPPQYGPFQAEIHQVHEREGYRIEAVSFNTFGGLRMTANAYIPHGDGPFPGVLAVHGHSLHGRRSQREQRRCAALATRGYFVLLVDCFGSGERAVELPGRYHGDLEAGALWLVGTSLFGVQVYENVRACDYLASRPEVDPDRLAISGASGGGNQSFYTGAWEPRFKVVVPVVAIGSYKKLVAANNCMCETPFGLAGQLEQSDILSLIAPRSLYVMNAIDDAVSFRYEEAARTVEQAAEVWKLLGVPERIAFGAFPTSHGYQLPMREACHGWFDRWLKGATLAEPVAEPNVDAEDYGAISCFPTASVPQVKTIRQFFADRRDARLRAEPTVSRDKLKERLRADMDASALRMEAFQRLSVPSSLSGVIGVSRLLHAEDGLIIPLCAAWKDFRLPPAERICIRVGDEARPFVDQATARQAIDEGWQVWAADLPGLGGAILPHERGDTQLNAARACHMLGFTLTGIWIRLLRQIIATARQEGASQVAVFASGRAATPILLSSALLESVDQLVVANPLASFAEGDVFTSVSLAAMVPDLLESGDILDWASLRIPAPLTIIAPVDPIGEPLSAVKRETLFAPIRARYVAAGHEAALRLLSPEEGALTGNSWLHW